MSHENAHPETELPAREPVNGLMRQVVDCLTDGGYTNADAVNLWATIKEDALWEEFVDPMLTLMRERFVSDTGVKL